MTSYFFLLFFFFRDGGEKIFFSSPSPLFFLVSLLSLGDSVPSTHRLRHGSWVVRDRIPRHDVEKAAGLSCSRRRERKKSSSKSSDRGGRRRGRRRRRRRFSNGDALVAVVRCRRSRTTRGCRQSRYKEKKERDGVHEATERQSPSYSIHRVSGTRTAEQAKKEENRQESIERRRWRLVSPPLFFFSIETALSLCLSLSSAILPFAQEQQRRRRSFLRKRRMRSSSFSEPARRR